VHVNQTRRQLLRCGLVLSCGLSLFGQTLVQPSLASGSLPLQKYRVFSIFPDYERVNVGQPIAAAVAGGEQFYDFAPHYGQGWEPFAQRFGAASASLATASLLSQAVMPAIFKQDPRYFRKGSGSVVSRLWYAIDRTVVTRQDSGASSFNYSQIGGLAATTASMNLYYPSADRTVSENVSRFGIGVGVERLTVNCAGDAGICVPPPIDVVDGPHQSTLPTFRQSRRPSSQNCM
jgi:hypothetical protein